MELGQSGRALVRDALSLLVPWQCAGCGAWDRSVCRRCTRVWAGTPRRYDAETLFLTHPRPAAAARCAVLPVWALAPYAGPARRMVLAWKSGARTDLDGFFAEVIARAVRDLPLPAGPLRVIPAPSGWRRRLRRRFVVGHLARAAGRSLDPERVDVADVLRTPDASLHAAGSARRRDKRRIRITHTGRRRTAMPVLLIDDVVTTGATLAKARAVLTAAGWPVAGALVLAATPGPGRSAS